MRKSFMIKVVRVGEPELSMRVNTPQIARRYWDSVIQKQSWFDQDKEHLVVLLLSVRYVVEGYSLVSIGSLSETIAHPREIFRAAVASGCHGIFVLHNHPSGDASPSKQDAELTCRLDQAAQILQIKLLDHIIIGRRRRAKTVARMGRKKREAIAAAMRGYFSFKEAGEL